MKTFIEVEVEVNYDYQPYEEQTRDYPGSPAYYNITSVMLSRPWLHGKRLQIDILEFLADKQIKAIEEELENCGRDEE